MTAEIFELAKFLHEQYEKAAKSVGWKTQDSCQVSFAELPEDNKTVMMMVAEQVIGYFKEANNHNRTATRRTTRKRNNMKTLNRKIKEKDFGSFQPSKQKAAWQEGEPTGKEHLYYFPEEWDYESKRYPQKTLCGKKFSLMTKKQDGWWGGYGAFKTSHCKCKKCKKMFKRLMKQ